jgi:class 3 adenylate cyclase/tetratricopeptide (TPR) repeat protein
MGGDGLEQSGREENDLAALDRAIAALEEQRAVVGDAVVDTAIQSLHEKRSALVSGLAGEQRKLVTVLFADLVDFTVLSQDLDAEDVRGVVNAYFVRWHEHIEANGGIVEKFIGDAVMAVFGLHQSREDDPHRAISAALGMRASLDDLNRGFAPRYGVNLAMRVGIDTGVVVVSALDDRPGQDLVVVGETVNRASRIQGAAPPGGVLISADTHRHVRGTFALQPMDGLRLKGITEPVDTFLVVSERPPRFRLDESRGVEGVDTRTVGRDVELRRLQDLYQDVVEDGQWRMVTIIGDAGVGKTRLLADFDRWIAELPEWIWWFQGRAASSDQDRPNALWRDIMANRLDIQESDGPDVVREKWELGFERLHGSPERWSRRTHDIARWLGFDLGGSEVSPPPGHDPRGLRDRAMTGLAEWFADLAEESPVVMLVEDLHWADDSSLAWIDAADHVLHDRPVLLLATARPALLERHPHWGEGLDFHDRLDVRSLSRRESRQLVTELLQKVDELPRSLRELVVTAADGNPFHIEELVKWLLDAGVITKNGETWQVRDQTVDRARVPPTLRGLLQARLDALLPPERATLQRAAVVGRVFWDAAVDSLARESGPAGTGGPSTAQALEQMRAREVVYERPHSAFDDTREFFFKHTLLRDVTYDSVLKSHRLTYHALVARWLEQAAERSCRLDQYAGLIAGHYDRAGDHTAATRWYLRAGHQATGVDAMREATGLLGRALELVPDTDPELQFDLHLAREAVYERLGERDLQQAALAELERLEPGLDDPSRTVQLLLRQGHWAFNASDFEAQVEAARQAIDRARAAGLEVTEVEAQLLCGQGLAWDSQHAAANEVLEEALAGARATGRPWLIGESLRYMAIVAGNQSDFDRSIELLEEARLVHRDSDEPDGEGLVLAQMATTFFNQGRYREARTYLEQALPIFTASGYKYRQAAAIGNLGTIVVMEGEFGTARRLLMEGLKLSTEVRDGEGTGLTQGMLGELYRRVGDLDRAERYLRDALETAEQIDFEFLASDSLVSLALVAVERGHFDEGERLAGEALAHARRGGSSLYEARALLARGTALALEPVERLADGEADLQACLALADEIGVSNLVVEAVAGLALAAFRRGDLDSAVALVDGVVDQLDPADVLGCLQPGEVYRTCWRVLGAGDDPRAIRVLRAAGAYLDEIAARIDEDDLREGFLRHVAANVELDRARRALDD